MRVTPLDIIQKQFVANRDQGTGVDPTYVNGNTVTKRTGR